MDAIEELDERIAEARAKLDLPLLLRLARRRSGLTLAAVSSRMTALGHQLSVSTLSAWERGNHQPERAASMDLLPDLAAMYGLDEGAIRELVTPTRPRIRDGTMIPEDLPPELERLLGEVGGLAKVRIHALHEIMTLDADRRRARFELRYVIEAAADDVDHYLTTWEAGESELEIVAGQGCTAGGDAHDGPFHVFRLDLGQTLHTGETHLFEYEMVRTSQAELPTYKSRWIGPTLRQFVLQVRFAEAPRAVWRCSWPTWGEAPRDDERVQLDASGAAHSIGSYDGQPRLFGLRWEW